jgi:hypothetical protein
MESKDPEWSMCTERRFERFEDIGRRIKEKQVLYPKNLKRSGHLCTTSFTFKQDRQCTFNVTWWRIRINILQWKRNSAFCVRC